MDLPSISCFTHTRHLHTNMFCSGPVQCTNVRFASFLSGGFITAIVVNPPERKLATRTSVQCVSCYESGYVYEL